MEELSVVRILAIKVDLTRARTLYSENMEDHLSTWKGGSTEWLTAEQENMIVDFILKTILKL